LCLQTPMAPGITRAVSVMAIQHESTLAEIPDPNPQTIQFEDPLDYTATYAAAGVDFLTVANNHQFDYGYRGVSNTRATLDTTGIAWGGIGATADSVRQPVVVSMRFTLPHFQSMRT